MEKSDFYYFCLGFKHLAWQSYLKIVLILCFLLFPFVAGGLFFWLTGASIALDTFSGWLYAGAVGSMLCLLLFTPVLAFCQSAKKWLALFFATSFNPIRHITDYGKAVERHYTGQSR